MVSDDDFIAACRESSNNQQAMDKLGLTDRRNFQRRKNNLEKKYEIDLKFNNPGRVESKDTYTKDEMEAVLKEKGDLRREITRLNKKVCSTDAYKKLINEVLGKEPDPPKWMYKKPKLSQQVHGVPTLFLSDLHWDEIVHMDQVNQVNEFNRTLAKERLKRTFESSVHLMKEVLTKADWPGAVVPLGGDMLSGYIHEELRENKSAPLFDGVLDLQDELIAGIDMMRREFGQVFVPCVVGNHGRLDRKPRAKSAVHDNVDWLLYRLIQKYYQGEKDVTVMVPDSTDAYYKIYNTRYMLTHGNQFRGGAGIAGPATPWALGDHKKRKRQDAINQPYDTLIFGHFHMLTWGGNNSYIANGSLKGYDEYAFNNNYGFEPPKQALWVTHPDKGITWKVEVFCDEDKDSVANHWVSVMKR